MTLTEKAAYLKGIADGMKLNAEEPVDKLLLSIIDMLDDVAKSVTSNEEEIELLTDDVDATKSCTKSSAPSAVKRFTWISTRSNRAILPAPPAAKRSRSNCTRMTATAAAAITTKATTNKFSLHHAESNSSGYELYPELFFVYDFVVSSGDGRCLISSQYRLVACSSLLRP